MILVDVNVLIAVGSREHLEKAAAERFFAALARKHGAKLATFDRALASVHGDVALLLGS